MDTSAQSLDSRGPTELQPAPDSSRQVDGDPTTDSRRTILLVEDDPAVRESLRRVLEEHGWRIIAVDTGEVALEMLQRQTPDLMITDLCLSAVSGWDLLFHENLQRPRLPIFVITGLPLHELKGAARFAAECFQKPLDLETLVAAVRSYLVSPESGAQPEPCS